MNEEMQKKIFCRYSQHGIKFKTWKELKQKTGLKEKKDIYCYYCGVKLEAITEYPHHNLVSLEHKIPKYYGGKNTIENTCLSCLKCNIIKGTMKETTYKIFLELLSIKPEAKKQILEEMFWGKNAKNNKITKPKKFLWELI